MNLLQNANTSYLLLDSKDYNNVKGEPDVQKLINTQKMHNVSCADGLHLSPCFFHLFLS